MDRVDFAGVLAHLVGRVGQPVEVAIGARAEGAPPFVAELSGTLRSIDDGFGADFPEVPPTDAPLVFGFEEHPSRFMLDPQTFEAGFTRGEHLEMTFGLLAIEVRVPIE